ncbi:hypothetical protein AgCh_035284 [Apium graveolens]
MAKVSTVGLMGQFTWVIGPKEKWMEKENLFHRRVNFMRVISKRSSGNGKRTWSNRTFYEGDGDKGKMTVKGRISRKSISLEENWSLSHRVSSCNTSCLPSRTFDEIQIEVQDSGRDFDQRKDYEK